MRSIGIAIGSPRARRRRVSAALVPLGLLLCLGPSPALAEEEEPPEDPFYADRFVIPEGSEFLEEERAEQGGDGAERLRDLERKHRSPWDPYWRAAAIALDGTLVRVPAAGSVVVGSVLFAVSLPAAAVSGMIDESLDAFVRSPYRFAIARPFGVFTD